MKEKRIKWLPLIICVGMLLLSGAVLGMYATPMKDVSLDLSLVLQEDTMVTDPADFDSKGWTVYTKEGDTVTELEPDGLGGYSGLELGQTFYYSRVMSEELDSPTLQIDTVENTISVWLDDMLIYTDCPDLDNRIGYLRLPMNDWLRSDPIIISLPMDYQGKTLTIAQSFPEYMETYTVKAWPNSVRLFCGYAYESGLISETFQTAIIVTAAFLIVLILLVNFVRSRDWSILCLALVAFCWMASQLIGTSFFYKYFGTADNAPESIIPLISALALLVFLTLRGGRHRKFLWGAVGLYALSVIGFGVVITALQNSPVENLVVHLFIALLPWWFAFAGLAAVLVLGAVYWRKESWFYRVFTPTASACILVSWLAVIILDKGIVWQHIVDSLGSGQIQYIYYRIMPAITAAALITAIAESVKNEIALRTEKQLLQQRQEMIMASYENIRRQHEEVMMLRHDMSKHFHILQAMSNEDQIKNYLADLIGQNQKVRAVVQTGNETLDIILNSKLSAARNCGITVEIRRAQAPASISMTDADLCSLMMNIMDNAVCATGKSREPHILLDVHTNNDLLAIICENTADSQATNPTLLQDTIPMHGLGLKIIQGIVEKYEGVTDTENKDGRFRIRIVIPLSTPAQLQQIY